VASTRDGKPYCPNDVAQATYPKAILAELAKRAEETTLLLKSKEIEEGGHLIREAMFLLTWSACTERRLGRMLDIPHRAVENLVLQLERMQRVKKQRTPRGSVIVELAQSPSEDEA